MEIFAFVGVIIILTKMGLMTWWIWILVASAIAWEVINKLNEDL